MAIKYRNRVTGRVVDRDGPDPALDRATGRWERLDGAEAAAPAAGTGTAERPAGNASTAAWRAYAVAQGMPAEEAEQLGRDELRERVGG